jgi:chemotaxis protein MotA
MESLILGVIAIGAVATAAFRLESFPLQNAPNALLLVLGGTLSVLFLSIPTRVLRSIFNSLMSLFRAEESFSHYQVELTDLIKNKTLESSSKSPLIHYARELWSQGVDSDLFIALISQKKQELEAKQLDAIQALKNLAKYPPAFGMVGTVVGMVALFSKLDQNKSNIGVSLSLAMVSTLLGLVLTNVFISPLADRLQVKHLNDRRVFESLYEILLLINSDEAASVTREELKTRAA